MIFYRNFVDNTFKYESMNKKIMILMNMSHGSRLIFTGYRSNMIKKAHHCSILIDKDKSAKDEILMYSYFITTSIKVFRLKPTPVPTKKYRSGRFRIRNSAHNRNKASPLKHSRGHPVISHKMRILWKLAKVNIEVASLIYIPLEYVVLE